MKLKFIKNKKKEKYTLEVLKSSDNCRVSKASNEIMLDRFYNGKGIQFPFNH